MISSLIICIYLYFYAHTPQGMSDELEHRFYGSQRKDLNVKPRKIPPFYLVLHI
jgi:hypothetical protein